MSFEYELYTLFFWQETETTVSGGAGHSGGTTSSSSSKSSSSSSSGNSAVTTDSKSYDEYDNQSYDTYYYESTSSPDGSVTITSTGIEDDLDLSSRVDQELGRDVEKHITSEGEGGRIHTSRTVDSGSNTGSSTRNRIGSGSSTSSGSNSGSSSSTGSISVSTSSTGSSTSSSSSSRSVSLCNVEQIFGYALMYSTRDCLFLFLVY